MADFNIQPVATQIRPVQGMSLGDMINIARGAQAYQQERQINPLELQAKQMAVQQAQQVNPLLLQQQQVATQTAQLNLANTQNQIAGGALTGLENSAAFKAGDAKGIKKELEATETIKKNIGKKVNKSTKVKK